ncbi:hypothetical protein Cgig2_005001 [Carnegiea gigantea]|uniref:Superoxide dismutase n=1 Tax=Carnegiea gigantea TaxID=171969 RepID=A0A9Q1L0Z9_9CARY|nr:hypothetical protein Cgig2_005001 [Carnegiea gigantea]
MGSCTTIPISSLLHANDLSQRMINSPTLPLQRERGRHGVKRGPRVVAYYGLKKPPYNLDALEPYMSKKMLECHWGEYHRGHLEALNRHLSGSDVLYGCTMDELVKVTYNNGNPCLEFNDAAQVWNHDFFWESMQPGGGDSPQLGLLKQIEKDFGSFTNFKEKFIEAASTFFGSGWRKEKRLEVVKTSNAITPIVWDDINDKATYANVFMDHLVSWHVVTLRILRAQAFVNLGEPKIPVA